MNDEQFLIQAIQLANESLEPVGCGVIIVSENEIVAESFNSQRTDNIAVNHAEIKAIIQANKKLNSRTIPNATAYCSCEPCAMCITALSYAKVKRIVFAQTMAQLFPSDPQSQFDTKKYTNSLNFKPQITQLTVT
jgi:guanine deaminase